MILAIIFVASVIYVSFCEYGLHRFIMHKPFFQFIYPFKAHAIVHHGTFKSDKTYHLQNDADKSTIHMAWWNGIVVVAIGSVPAILASVLFGTWWILIMVSSVAMLYYCVYEYSHWCMHLPLPERRIIESWPVIGWMFYRLNGHHLLHHRYMHKNFNVVLPLADFCLGTLLLRSKIKFPQARGISVPDVQPKEKKV